MKYACYMRKFLSFGLVLAFSFTSSLIPAHSAIKSGDTCKSVGQTTSVNGSTLICTKSGSKLLWTKSSKADSYDAAFANAFLAEAKKNAAKILADAKVVANQISSPPNCSTSNSRAFASIGGDPSTGLKALVFENPGQCELGVSASAVFFCDGAGRKMSNVVTSTGTFSLKAGQTLLVSYNISNYFPQVITDCRLLTRVSSNLVNISTLHQAPSVKVISSIYTGAFNQNEANKKANQHLKTEKARADKVISDAKKPAVIAKAWKEAAEAAATAAIEAAAREIAEAPAKAAAETAAAKEAADVAARAALDAGIGKNCIPETNCPLGSIGPGKGIVIFDAGSRQSWGRYIEIARDGWSGSATDPKANWCDTTSDGGFIEFLENPGASPAKSKLSREIGTGISNTNLMLTKCTTGAALLARSYKGGGMSDWSLPSADEFAALIKYQMKSGWFYKGYDIYNTYHFTSTEWTYHYSLAFQIQTQFGGPYQESKGALKFVRPFRTF